MSENKLTEDSLKMDFDVFMMTAVKWSMSGGHERKAAVVEWLSAGIGSYIAVMTGGNSEAVNELLTGAQAYQFEVAAEKAVLVRRVHNK